MFERLKNGVLQILPGRDSPISVFYQREENRKRAAKILIAALLLASFQMGRGLGGGKKYLLDDQGGVRGLYRPRSGVEASYPLRLRAQKGGLKTERELMLTLRGERKKAESSEKGNRRSQMDQALDRMLQEVGGTSGKGSCFRRGCPMVPGSNGGSGGIGQVFSFCWERLSWSSSCIWMR